MAPDPTNPEQAVSQEDLVAYLDGELDEPASRRIEELLATDPKVRQSLQQLERTWDLLDKLDAPEVDEKLAQSTLEVVAVAAAEDARRREAELPRRRRRQWLLGTAGLLAAALTGFLSVALLRPDPQEQLLEDLPLLDNFDQYRQIDDFRFLKMLHDEGLFAEEQADDQAPDVALPDPAESVPAGASRAERRRWLETASPARKADLAMALERLEALDAAEQHRLRELNRQIEEDPDGQHLGEVMRRYHQWLKKLPLYRRAEVIEPPAAQRIAIIKKMQEEADQRALRQPDPQDAEGLLSWMKEYAARHEAEILATLPEDRRQEELKASPDHRRRLVMSMLWTRWHSGKGGNVRLPGEADLAEVRSRLAPATRRRLESRSPEEQWRLIGSWARYLVHYQGDLRPGAAPFPEPGEAELVHFFEYELTPEQRDYLLGLPGEDMQRRLRQMYFRIKLPRSLFQPLDHPDSPSIWPGPSAAEKPRPKPDAKPAKGRTRP